MPVTYPTTPFEQDVKERYAADVLTSRQSAKYYQAVANHNYFLLQWLNDEIAASETEPVLKSHTCELANARHGVRFAYESVTRESKNARTKGR